ncbi:sugar-binding protein [Marinobacter panjinensis]|uniref:Sugar-binding protein n=2 Tax=Marinobacter panjinensis TaxID=2576384 RepID=A0A4U6RAP0_9GAMM|nr:sugar-binding protein [Marinobacter panjinensis]
MDAFRSGKFSKGTSAFTAFMFTFVFYLSPNGKAVADELTKEDVRQAKIEKILENTPEKKLAHRLEKLKQKLSKELPNAVEKRNEGKGWVSKALDTVGIGDMPLTAGEIAELNDLKTGINQAYDEAITEFDQEGTRLSARQGMPEGVKELIRERHAEALERVQKRYGTVKHDLEQLTTTQDAEEQQEILDKLSESLGNEKFKRSHTADDPNKLPWRSPSDKVREPKTNKRNLQAALGIDSYAEYVQVASRDLTPEMLVSGDVAVGKGVTEADLQETIDIQITDEIRELAESLDNNPVEIYTWVHNNIRFVPSYGSIQGSQYTLETKRGNASDTASLLLSLLRAANIPAKYAYGTVEIPVDKVMNWVGGVTKPEAAQSLLGQGGIPNVALIEGGKITKIRMEHTWVEAFVDFEPSRGIKNREGDNWIPMDASFKQYEFTEGMSLKDRVPFDAQSLKSNIEEKVVNNEEDGWIENVPQGDIEAELQQFQSQVENFIADQNPDATIGEVLGLQEIRVLPPRPLAAGLPYQHIVTQDSFSELPESLRHRFKYELATQSYGFSNSPFISVNEPTAKLAGKKLALSFRPATDDDRAVIESYLPAPDPNIDQINPDGLPNSLPGYLINLVADFTIDGDVIQSSTAQTMGAELHETLGLFSPSHNWFTSDNAPIVGEHRVIGLDLQGISPSHAEALKDNLEETKVKLESRDSSQLATLSKQDLIGDLLHGTIMSYFAINDLQEDIQAQSSNMVTYRLPSYGIFSTTLQPQYWFGVPRDTNFSGLTIDVDAVTFHGVAKDNSNQTRVNFTRSSGTQWSANEHLIPEKVFSTPEAPAYGISAVKALALAGAEGQKIWTIDRNNVSLAISQINLGSEVETEIRNAVSAGKIATVHEQKITYRNWVGAGYLLIDPETGAGAYKIAGGANGGFLDGLGSIATWLGLGFAYKELLALIATSPSIVQLFSQIGSFLFALSFGLSVYDLATNCSDANAARLFIIVYTVVTLMVLALLFAFAGPLGTIIGLSLLGFGLNRMSSLIKSTPLCR